jgi:hypothetical protein
MTKTKKNWSQILPKLFFLWQADLAILFRFSYFNFLKWNLEWKPYVTKKENVWIHLLCISSTSCPHAHPLHYILWFFSWLNNHILQNDKWIVIAVA